MSHVSTLELHQLHLAELPEQRVSELEAHLQGCARCAARLAMVRAEAEAFDDTLPAALQGLGDDTPQPAEAVHWLVYLRRLAPLALALAAAALLFVAVPSRWGEPPAGSTRTRGELPLLEVWVAAPEGPRPLRQGEALSEGDRVQLLYDAGGAAKVGLAGRDGTGAIEVYGVVTPQAKGLHPAPFGLALDDAPGPQVFYVVPGGVDLNAEAVERAVSEVPLPHGVVSITVPKARGR